MAINLAQLRAIARGETYPKTGVSGVAALQTELVTPAVTPKTPAVTPVTCVTPQNCRVGKGSEKGGFEGVSGGVSSARVADIRPAAEALREQCGGNAKATPAPVVVSFDPVTIAAMAEKRNCEAARLRRTDRWCGVCGRMAAVAVGRFKPSGGNPEGVTSWRCVECFDRGA